MSSMGRAVVEPRIRVRAARFSRSAAWALVVAWASVVAGPAALAQGAAPMTLSMGGAPIVPYASSIIAAGKGYFTEAGLTVQRKPIFSADVARTALASGDIEVAGMAIDTLSLGHLAGFDWKILAGADIYDPKTPDAQIVARSDLAITSAKDLEGKTVAVTLGTIAEVGFKAWMRSKGGDPGKARIVELSFPQMVGALEAKNIDAAHMVFPGLAVAVERNIGKIVGPDLDVVGGRFLVAVYVARASWIAANPEKAKRFVQAVGRATKFIIEAPPSESVPIVAADTKLDPALVAKFFPSLFGPVTEVAPSEIQIVIDFLAREKFIQSGFSYRDIVSDYVKMKP